MNSYALLPKHFQHKVSTYNDDTQTCGVSIVEKETAEYVVVSEILSLERYPTKFQISKAGSVVAPNYFGLTDVRLLADTAKVELYVPERLKSRFRVGIQSRKTSKAESVVITAVTEVGAKNAAIELVAASLKLTVPMAHAKFMVTSVEAI